MWGIRGNNGNTTCLNFALFIADYDPGKSFNNKRDFNVRMLVQGRTLSGFGGYNVGGEGRTLRFADKFMRHSGKWQLVNVQEAHG